MSRKLIDLTGQRFGRLVAIARAPENDKYGRPIWTCRCDCGASTVVHGTHLRSGHTVSCGCLHRETGSKRMAKLNLRHGMTHTPEHRVWDSMIARCANPNHRAWASYGGRGITVCERWQRFENFLADMGPRPAGRSKSGKRATYSLERIDNNEGYSPANCRWATHSDQQLNRRAHAELATSGDMLRELDRRFGGTF